LCRSARINLLGQSGYLFSLEKVSDMKNKTVDIGMVLQGGGALGAYEWGAIQCLIEHNFTPKVIAGVSIGAYTYSRKSQQILARCHD
jgi:hypothetical protein